MTDPPAQQLTFSAEEVLGGRPRELALSLDPPLNFALEKALRRHVAYRIETAEELWRDLHSPPGLPTEAGDEQSACTEQT